MSSCECSYSPVIEPEHHVLDVMHASKEGNTQSFTHMQYNVLSFIIDST